MVLANLNLLLHIQRHSVTLGKKEANPMAERKTAFLLFPQSPSLPFSCFACPSFPGLTHFSALKCQEYVCYSSYDPGQKCLDSSWWMTSQAASHKTKTPQACLPPSPLSMWMKILKKKNNLDDSFILFQHC